MEILVERYITKSGKDVFGEWLRDLKDNKAAAKVAARITRLTTGNFGDSKFLRDGIYELRIDYGPGYRVYYGMMGKAAILLLCGGDKRKQNSDIEKAIEYFKDYKNRAL